MVGFPFNCNSVRSTTWILGTVFNFVEQKLMCTTNWSQVWSILTPINRYDERVVLCAFSFQVIVVVHFIDIDGVIVGTNSKIVSIWRVFNNFDPFLGIFVCCNDLIEFVISSSNCQSTIIVTNSDVTILGVIANTSWALWIWQFSQWWSTTLWSLSWFSRDFSSVFTFSCWSIPCLDLVVITWCNNVSSITWCKTPNFSIRMSFHNSLFGSWTNIHFIDGTISQSY